MRPCGADDFGAGLFAIALGVEAGEDQFAFLVEEDRAVDVSQPEARRATLAGCGRAVCLVWKSGRAGAPILRVGKRLHRFHRANEFLNE